MANTLSRARQNAPIVHTARSLGNSPASSSRPHFCFMAHPQLLLRLGAVAPCSTCSGPLAGLAPASPRRSVLALEIRRNECLVGSSAAPTFRPGPFGLLHWAWLHSEECRAPT